MRREKPICLIAILVLSTFLCPNLLCAAPYYEGKTIKLIIGSGAGGAYDQIARLFARHLPKYLPGKPVVVPENMPGASTMIAANHLYSVAKPDGLTIGTFNRGIPFAQLLKVDGARFDVRRFSWIGSGAVEATVLVMRTDVPYKTVDDLRKAKDPIHLAGLGPGASDNQFPSLLKEFLGINFKMVIYPSGNEGKLAIETERGGRQGGVVTALFRNSSSGEWCAFWSAAGFRRKALRTCRSMKISSRTRRERPSWPCGQPSISSDGPTWRLRGRLRR